MKVYDILDAGPRNRFTVRGRDNLPLIVHNCVQSLARDIIAEQMLQIDKRFHVVGTVHDEVICVVANEEVEEAQEYMLECMRTPPAWAPGLCLDAEIGVGDSYGESH